jgi:hypothetical protein
MKGTHSVDPATEIVEESHSRVKMSGLHIFTLTSPLADRIPNAVDGSLAGVFSIAGCIMHGPL